LAGVFDVHDHGAVGATVIANEFNLQVLGVSGRLRKLHIAVSCGFECPHGEQREGKEQTENTSKMLWHGATNV
jgi:hypothetical protein